MADKKKKKNDRFAWEEGVELLKKRGRNTPVEDEQAQIAKPGQTFVEFARPIPRTVQDEERDFRTLPENKIKEATTLFEDLKDMVTGSLRETPQTRDLPETTEPGSPFSILKPGEEGSEFKNVLNDNLFQNLKITGLMWLNTNAEDRKKTLRENVEEPEKLSFTEDENENIIGNYRGQQFVLNKPGFSSIDAGESLVDIMAFIPAGKVASFGANVVGKTLLAATGAFGTELGLQKSREEFGAAKQRTSDKIVAAGIAGATEFVGPLASAAGRKLKPVVEGVVGKFAPAYKDVVSRVGTVVDEDAFSSIQRAEKLREEIPIDLLTTQVTGSKADELLQRVLSEQPASSRSMMRFIKRQDEQAHKAVNAFLTKIAPTSSLVDASEKFKDAAKKSINDLKILRSDATDELYNELFRDPPEVDINRVVHGIESRLDVQPKGKIRNTLKTAKQIITGGKDKVKLFDANGNIINAVGYDKVSLDVLHRAKMEIDDMIQSKGDSSLGNNAKRILKDIKLDLLNVMESREFGGSEAYGSVRKLYREMSNPIDDIERSVIGTVSRIKDTDMLNISKKIFSVTDPIAMRKIKTVIDNADPEAFPLLLKSFLRGKILDIGKAAVDQPKALSSALFKNTSQRRAIKEVLPKDLRKNATWLEESLEKASLGRIAGSDTATKQQILKKLSGTLGAPLVSVILPAATLGSVGAALSGARLLSTSLKKSTLDKRSRILAEALTNEKWSTEMSRIRSLSFNSPASIKAFSQLLNNVEIDINKEDNSRSIIGGVEQ